MEFVSDLCIIKDLAATLNHVRPGGKQKTALCCNAIHNSVFFLFSSLDTLLSLFIYLLLKFICYSARLQLKKKESVQWKTVPEHVNALMQNILIKLEIQIVSVATIIHSNSVK